MENSLSTTRKKLALCIVTLMILLLVGVLDGVQSNSIARQLSAADQNSIILEKLGGQVLPDNDAEYLLIMPHTSLSSLSSDQQFIGTQNGDKRASRRVSSFMPMRGRRKDARQSLYHLSGIDAQPETESELYYVPSGEWATSDGTAERGLSSSLMQARLRRAFHPMRGKRSDMSATDSDGLEFIDRSES